MKRNFTIKMAVGAMALALSLFWVPGLQAQTTHNVSVTSNAFTPDEITIAAGDEVLWINSEGEHNVNGTTDTYPDNPESFGNNVGSGWSYSYVFNTPGVYDYQCDPHVFQGMTGTIIVEAVALMLNINFTGMTPHVGQDLWLRVENDDTNEEIYRSVHTVSESFSVEVPGIESGSSYVIDFFADHNGNGYYDAPGEDHAWSIDLENVTQSETVNFAHNTNFTDIEWEHRAIMNLSGMNPHVGQEIYFALIETSTGEIVDRKSETVSESFTVELDELIPGMDYHIDFFADFNENGFYDQPSEDHAWRVEITDAGGDEVINFAHNTNFTDIAWKHRLRVDFFGMTPHIGQMMKLYVIDRSDGTVIDSVIIDAVPDAEFDIEAYGIVPGSSYTIDFYADMNENGTYDVPPADHAWRIKLLNVGGDEEIEFTHNTNFTDIDSIATSVRPDRSGMELKIYPNPAENLLTIEAESVIESVGLYSVAGAHVRSYHNVKSKTYQVAVSDMEPGVYFLRVSSEGKEDQFVRVIRK